MTLRCLRPLLVVLLLRLRAAVADVEAVGAVVRRLKPLLNLRQRLKRPQAKLLERVRAWLVSSTPNSARKVRMKLDRSSKPEARATSVTGVWVVARVTAAARRRARNTYW